MKRMLWTMVLSVVCIGAYAQAPDPTPIVQEILLTDVLPVRHGDVAMGDFDADVDLDMLLTGARGGPSSPNPTTALYRSLGDTTLLVVVDSVAVEVDAVHMQRVRTVALPNLWKSSVEWGDFDNDQNLDLALMGVDVRGNIVTAVYRQSPGSRTFQPRFQAPIPLHSGDLIWADVDNDGDLDLAVCGLTEEGEPRTLLFDNRVRDGGSFQEIGSGLVDVGHCTLDLADFDIDGDLDFLVTGTTSDGGTMTAVYQNDGRGRFSRYFQPFEDFLFASASWGDFDADGYVDFIVAGGRLTPFLMQGDMELYRYDTTDTDFERATARIMGAFAGDPVTGRYLGDVSWGDIDNDGFHEFVVTGAESPRTFNATQIYRSSHGQSLEKSEADKFDGGYRGRSVIADYDMDRDLDVIVFGENPGLPGEGTRIRMLRNNLIFGKLAPVPPDAIDATVNGRNVTLAWSPGFDRQTRSAGLTYNIRIGTSPGSADYIAPMADLATGKRYVSRRGLGTSLTWTIFNMKAGTYYWAVQSLDQTFSGSVFSHEGTFTVE